MGEKCPGRSKHLIQVSVVAVSLKLTVVLRKRHELQSGVDVVVDVSFRTRVICNKIHQLVVSLAFGRGGQTGYVPWKKKHFFA